MLWAGENAASALHVHIPIAASGSSDWFVRFPSAAVFLTMRRGRKKAESLVFCWGKQKNKPRMSLLGCWSGAFKHLRTKLIGAALRIVQICVCLLPDRKTRPGLAVG